MIKDPMVEALRLSIASRYEDLSPHQRFMLAHDLMHSYAAECPELKSLRVNIRYHRPKKAPVVR